MTHRNSGAAQKTDIIKRYNHTGCRKRLAFPDQAPRSRLPPSLRLPGFQYRFDPKTGQLAHATAIMVLTSTGKISQYYYGVDFSPKDLRLSLIQASNNNIGTVADAVLLYCFHYDPATGKYSVLIGRVIQVAGGLTILLLFGGMFFLLTRRRPDHESRRRGGFVINMFDNFPLWPTSASVHARYEDWLFIFLTVVSAAMTLLIFATVAIFAMKYRRRHGREATQIEGSLLLEIDWSMIPLGI